MVPHRLRLWLAVIIFLLAVAVLVASFWPYPRVQQVLPMPPILLPTATPLSFELLWRSA